MSAAHDYRRTEADGPRALANRMAAYVRDARYIASYVDREFGNGRAPCLDTIRQMQIEHRRQREAFKRESEKPNGYNPDNDNGEPFKVASLVRLKKPKPAKRNLPRKENDGRIPVLARCREQHEALRNAKAMRAGPIARDIIERTADWFGLTPEDILSSSRRQYLVSARFVALRLISEVRYRNGELRFSKAHVGRIMGGRDHSTILHALSTFADRARKYEEMMEAYEALSA